MTGMLPRTGVATSQCKAVIIDGRLALSRYGLLISLRLADRARVWLVRTLWSLLDNDQFFQDRPELIDDNGRPGEAATMLAEWRRAWLGANMLNRCCWIGDARHESLLPFDMPEGSVERFEFLSGLFDGRNPAGRGESPLGECARDAICLAAVLCASGSVILTPGGRNGHESRLCTMLEAAGIPCAEIEDERAAAMLSAETLPTGLVPLARQLAGNGFELAAVHLLVPHALVASPADADDLEWPAQLPEGEVDPWADASALWHRIA